MSAQNDPKRLATLISFFAISVSSLFTNKEEVLKVQLLFWTVSSFVRYNSLWSVGLPSKAEEAFGSKDSNTRALKKKMVI